MEDIKYKKLTIKEYTEDCIYITERDYTDIEYIEEEHKSLLWKSKWNIAEKITDECFTERTFEGGLRRILSYDFYKEEE